MNNKKSTMVDLVYDSEVDFGCSGTDTALS